MALSLDDVRRIADLACIAIDAEELDDIRAKLESILGLIGELQAIDTEGIEPMSHALDITAPMRDDKVTETDRHEQFQKGSPHVEDGLYLVPRVVE